VKAPSKPAAIGRRAASSDREEVRNEGFREPRFEVNRRILLRAILAVIVLAFLGVIVRLASIGFGGSVRGVDRADREMQHPGAAAVR